MEHFAVLENSVAEFCKMEIYRNYAVPPYHASLLSGYRPLGDILREGISVLKIRKATQWYVTFRILCLELVYIIAAATNSI